MNNPPIIRIELEGMKHTIAMMLSEHLVQMDADIQAAVDAFCTPENVSKIIADTASKEIEQQIKLAVTRFYTYGDGQKAIAAAVEQTMRERAEQEERWAAQRRGEA
jgi:hypothetical protein